MNVSLPVASSLTCTVTALSCLACYAVGGALQAWLKMNVSLEMIGEVSFNFSVDIPKGDTSRGFFFYVDDTPIDEMVVRPRHACASLCCSR